MLIFVMPGTFAVGIVVGISIPTIARAVAKIAVQQGSQQGEHGDVFSRLLAIDAHLLAVLAVDVDLHLAQG